jgi:hypothetical protein
VAIPVTPDERRGVTPVQPLKPPLAGPVPGTQPDRDRKAQPTRPPAKVAPSAPPSRIEVPPSPGAAPLAKPGASPKKAEDADNKDEKKKDEKPGR